METSTPGSEDTLKLASLLDTRRILAARFSTLYIQCHHDVPEQQNGHFNCY